MTKLRKKKIKKYQLQLVNDWADEWSLFMWNPTLPGKMYINNWSDSYGLTRQICYITTINMLIVAYKKDIRLYE